MPDSKQSREDFLFTARKRFDESASDEKHIRDQATLDLNFVAGNQWRADVESERASKGRLCLKFNRCHTFVQQVSNEARQNKPQIKFVVGDGGDPDTAEVKEGMARHIQYDSDAQIAYETAVEYSAGGSFAYFRFLTEYCDDESWDQDLKVVPVYDPFSIYGVLIPACFGMEPDYAFVVEDIPIERYKREYDTKEIDAVGGWDNATKLSQGWIGTETVRVAEYWYIEHEEKTLTRKNPQTGEDETRTVDKCKVKFCKLNGLEVIEGTETEWPGYCIPIVPVLGKQMIIDGKPNLFSVVRFQRDPQQLINYYKTRIAETLSTAPIQPYLVAKGQIDNSIRSQWERMNIDQKAYIEYVHQTGSDAPPPTRQVFEAPINSLSEASQQEIDDMKAVTGIYDASLGAKSNESSGIALQRRQQQSNVTNMHFLDNLERAFKKGGLIIADVLPYIYDAKRMVHILGPDEAPKIVKINAPHRQADGKTYHYKVGGDGAQQDKAIVTMGRAFSTKRQESFDMMTSVLQQAPQLLEVMGDVFFQNSDMAGSDVIAERMKRFIQIKYPGLVQDKEHDPQAQMAHMQAQAAASQQAMQVLQAELQKLQQEKQGKVVDNEYRMAMEKMKLENQLLIAEIQTKAQSQSERMELFLDQAAKLLDHAHEHGTQLADQAHERDMAQRGHQQALEQGAQAGAIQAANQPQPNGAAQ